MLSNALLDFLFFIKKKKPLYGLYLDVGERAFY